MTTDELIAAIRALDHGWGLQDIFDPTFESSCPCFGGVLRLDEGIIGAQGKCWRVSVGDEQDLYVWGTLPRLEEVAVEIKRALDAQEWYNPYHLYVSDAPFGITKMPHTGTPR